MSVVLNKKILSVLMRFRRLRLQLRRVHIPYTEVKQKKVYNSGTCPGGTNPPSPSPNTLFLGYPPPPPMFSSGFAGYPSGSQFRNLGPYYGPFEEIGSLKDLYIAEKVPKISKIAPRAINS